VAKSPWRNRIVGYSEEEPDQLLANPSNWRIHPAAQQNALSGVLKEVGLVQNVVANRTTGHLVDGHLRVMLAMRENQPVVPVTWVELSEEEEHLILAALDPLAAMATADAGALDALLSSVQSGEAAVQAMLAELAEGAGLYVPVGGIDPSLIPEGDRYKEQYGVIIICADEPEQQKVYEALAADGYMCRVVVT
jgi:ParB-like chromosome segregation protein Spo0J